MYKFYRYRECERFRIEAEHSRRDLDRQVVEREERVTCASDDLKVEREWRTSLQETVQKDRDKLAQMGQELAHLRQIATVQINNHLKNYIPIDLII